MLITSSVLFIVQFIALASAVPSQTDLGTPNVTLELAHVARGSGLRPITFPLQEYFNQTDLQ